MWSGYLTQVKLWVADMVYMCPKEPEEAQQILQRSGIRILGRMERADLR